MYIEQLIVAALAIAVFVGFVAGWYIRGAEKPTRANQ